MCAVDLSDAPLGEGNILTVQAYNPAPGHLFFPATSARMHLCISNQNKIDENAF